MIKGIIFDCFGVLIMSGREALFQNVPEQASAIKDLERQSDYGLISREAFTQAAADLAGVQAADIDREYWWTSVRQESMFALVRELRQEKGYKVALLSNIGRGWIDDFLPEAERAELFDTVVLSSEVGLMKPAQEIFELTAQQLGLLPEECLMIDDMPVNIDGAKRAGMPGIVCQTVAQVRHDLEQHLA